MAASAMTPLWKRLVIVLCAIAAGIAVPFLVDQAGAPALVAYAAGVVALLVVFLVVAGLLHVRLKWHSWE
jgi:hypothetical protein